MSETHPHLAKGVVFGCMDDRYNQYLTDFLAAHGPLFTPSLAGGALALLLPQTRDVVLLQLKAAREIAPAGTNVYLQAHLNCGAYVHPAIGGYTFKDEAEEVATKWQHLREAEALVKAEIPEANIQLALIDLDGRPVAEPR